MSLPPQQMLDAYHASMGSDYVGVPKMPRNIAEPRVLQLQEELANLSEDADNYESFSQKLQTEIAETQAILDNQEYTEDPTEIQYWDTYREGLKNFVLNMQQSQQGA